MANAKYDKVIWLLGAGASAEAGVFTSNKITEVLLNYSSYCPSKESADIENLIRYTQVRIADFMGVRASDVNFEYLLGALMELSKKHTQTLVPFFGEEDQLIKRLETKIGLGTVIERLFALLREMLTIRYPVDYLKPVREFVKLGQPMDLFTLNYDLTLEKVCESTGMVCTTGFKLDQEKNYVWDPTEFDRRDVQVRIFKLHGSLSWGQYFGCPPPEKGSAHIGSTRAAKLFLEHYPQRIEFDPTKVSRVEPPDRDHGLIATMNFGTRKELQYTSSQFTVLFNHFWNALLSSKICIVAGYSFQDERINSMIEEAVATLKGKLRLIVINPNANRIQDINPLLWTFRKFNWCDFINKGLGETLKDQSLLDCIQQPPEPPLDYEQPSVKRSDRSVSKPNSHPDLILANWRHLGIAFDRASLWLKFLSDNIKIDIDSNNITELRKIGTSLLPFVGCVRDMCYQIGFVYESMGVGGTYGRKYLDSINTAPNRTTDNLNFDLIEKETKNLGPGFYMALGEYQSRSEEFKRGVQDPKYGEAMDAPSNLSAAELVIRKVTDRIYELTVTINDLYVALGYEGPFDTLARHYKSLYNLD